eukprot:540378-Lingulodinium_polyedra.AAC.1
MPRALRVVRWKEVRPAATTTHSSRGWATPSPSGRSPARSPPAGPRDPARTAHSARLIKISQT